MQSPSPLTYTFDEVNHIDFDLYLPPTAKGSIPAVIAFHGGGMTSGSKKDMLAPTYMIEKLHARGVAFISANYRLLYPSTAEEIIENVHQLFKYLASPSTAMSAHLDILSVSIDSNRLAVLGISGGNYLARAAATLTTVQPQPKAWISLYGMSNDWMLDFWVGKNPSGEYMPILLHDQDTVDALVAAHGGPVSSDAPLAINVERKRFADPTGRVTLFTEWQAQGVFLDYLLDEPGVSAKLREVPHKQRQELVPEAKRRLLLPLNRATVPVYYIHGTVDNIVPIQESYNAYEQSTELGLKVGKGWIEGASHGLLDPSKPPGTRREGWEPVVEDALDFVVAHFQQ
ncbi:hypothetical protein IAU60_006547 [Kwoniella sp. DSM 27419]